MMRVMHSIVYLMLLVLGYFGSSGIFVVVERVIELSNLDTTLKQVLISVITSSIVRAFFGLVVQTLIGYRLLCWIKARHMAPPPQFSGVMGFFGWMVALFMMAVVMGYIWVIFFTTGSGMSSVPLALALLAASSFALIPLISCESRNFYALLSKRY
jgi:Na+/proline symporter